MEKVNHPQHYGGDAAYETIKVIRAWGLGFNLGTALKHISRAGKKPGEERLTDLEKARWYLDDEIAYERSLLNTQIPPIPKSSHKSPDKKVEWDMDVMNVFSAEEHLRSFMPNVSTYSRLEDGSNSVYRYYDQSGVPVARVWPSSYGDNTQSLMLTKEAVRLRQASDSFVRPVQKCTKACKVGNYACDCGFYPSDCKISPAVPAT